MSFTQLEIQLLLCGRDFLALPIWYLELVINKINQNYLKQCDLAPLKTFNLTYCQWLLSLFV